MNNEGKTTTSILAMIVPALICAVALAVGYRAYTAAHDARRDYQRDIASVRDELGGIKAQIGALSNALVAAARKPTSTIVSSSGGWSSGKDDMTDSLMALETDLSDIRKTLNKTGLESVATNDVDQAALHDIIGEYAERKMVEIRREQLGKLLTTQSAADIEKYGAELTNLYASARGNWGRNRGGGDDQQRDAALKDLQQKFPDAYATAKAVGDRAVSAMFSQNTEQVEQYYKQLGDMKQASSVVNDWGMQTMPAVEYYLASKYIEQNRSSDAEKLLSSLEKNYPDALIPSMMTGGRGRGGFGGDHGPHLATVSSATSALRQKMQGN